MPTILLGFILRHNIILGSIPDSTMQLGSIPYSIILQGHFPMLFHTTMLNLMLYPTFRSFPMLHLNTRLYPMSLNFLMFNRVFHLTTSSIRCLFILLGFIPFFATLQRASKALPYYYALIHASAYFKAVFNVLS